ncbi:acireductone synthase [Synechococcus sp. RS9916]|uniref:acireductone synthase n=1 Tax=Synechococcus sp. RS9916 TaxID=221359 RepID=UPI0000E53E4A|nr:acireductone synthase [Synechococcus sp. RS9916]EAU72951.1 putative enolase-phosphatase E-1 [Synechococcus sp. RS9916]
MITHLLLDIEGTTCPITFVSSVLFPYAKRQLKAYLDLNDSDDEVRQLIKDAWNEWRVDPDPKSQAMLKDGTTEAEDHGNEGIHGYLQHLISIDRKSTTLKDLQGRIWKQGYDLGSIQSELYPEALAALHEWASAGYKLAVYSSGSVAAQQLLYQHTPGGDVRHLFSAWFDTRTGPKKESQSYQSIAREVNTPARNIAFISDNKAECDAAEEAGMNTIFSLRDGNPDQSPGHHMVITSLHQVLDMIKANRET